MSCIKEYTQPTENCYSPSCYSQARWPHLIHIHMPCSALPHQARAVNTILQPTGPCLTCPTKTSSNQAPAQPRQLPTNPPPETNIPPLPTSWTPSPLSPLPQIPNHTLNMEACPTSFNYLLPSPFILVEERHCVRQRLRACVAQLDPADVALHVAVGAGAFAVG